MLSHGPRHRCTTISLIVDRGRAELEEVERKAVEAGSGPPSARVNPHDTREYFAEQIEESGGFRLLHIGHDDCKQYLPQGDGADTAHSVAFQRHRCCKPFHVTQILVLRRPS